jgi:membrane protein implicated in regulation of membrane protease activity
MKTIRTRRPLALALVGAFALLAAGCATTNVARLLAEPQRYANRNVGLKGDVVESVSLLGHGAYKLDDGTGTIWIVSKHGVPRRGARVKVKGKIRDVVDVSTIFKLPEEIGSGLVMIEDEHRAR